MDIKIPDFLNHLTTYKGHPVPHTVFWDDNGVPDFKVLDMGKWYNSAKKKLCGVCGKKMNDHFFFIGGEKSLQSGLFMDMAMHKQCALYSFETCPYLRGDIGYSKHYKQGVIIPNIKTDTKALGLYEAVRYKLIHDFKTNVDFLKAGKAISIQYLRKFEQ